MNLRAFCFLVNKAIFLLSQAQKIVKYKLKMPVFYAIL